VGEPESVIADLGAGAGLEHGSGAVFVLDGVGDGVGDVDVDAGVAADVSAHADAGAETEVEADVPVSALPL